jgi:hypothetical protein
MGDLDSMRRNADAAEADEELARALDRAMGKGGWDSLTAARIVKTAKAIQALD